jgi:hypothetical protein
MSDRDRELSPRIPPDTRHDEQDPEHAASTSQAAPAEDPITGTTPAFEPLFTLLTNTTTNTTIHPRVHYLFSDDDPSILPAPITPDPSHRALVVDLVHDATGTGGWSVAWASSLSPDFAVAESSISVVQQGDRDDGSIMLKIDGVEREPVNTRSSNTGEGGGGGGSPSNSGASGTVGKEDVDILVDDFRRRMGVLRRVVGQGDKRREVLDQQHQVEDSEGRQEHSPEHPADTGDAQAQARARAEPQDSKTKAADESQQVKPDA